MGKRYIVKLYVFKKYIFFLMICVAAYMLWLTAVSTIINILWDKHLWNKNMAREHINIILLYILQLFSVGIHIIMIPQIPADITNFMLVLCGWTNYFRSFQGYVFIMAVEECILGSILYWYMVLFGSRNGL